MSDADRDETADLMTGGRLADTLGCFLKDSVADGPSVQ